MFAVSPQNDKPAALEDRARDQERLFSPSAARNRDAIREVFLAHMPLEGAVLEIGAGTGEHAVHIASAAPGLVWRASDPDPASRRSIAAWIAHAGLANVEGPHEIDATQPGAADGPRDLAGVISINMIHIAPFEAARGLFAIAGARLREDGRLFLYGPFSEGGAHNAPSNEAFDASLKARDPRWGVRDVTRDLAPLASARHLRLAREIPMPANNRALIYAPLAGPATR